MPDNVLSEILDFVSKSELPLTLADAKMDDCPLLAVSEGFVTLTGYSRSELVGKNCRLLQCEQTTLEQRMAFRFSLIRGEEGEHRITNMTKDGRRFENLVTMFPFYEPQSNRTFVCASQYDISKPLRMLKGFREATEKAEATGTLGPVGLERDETIRWDNAHAIINSRRQMASLVQRQIAMKLIRLQKNQLD